MRLKFIILSLPLLAVAIVGVLVALFGTLELVLTAAFCKLFRSFATLFLSLCTLFCSRLAFLRNDQLPLKISDLLRVGNNTSPRPPAAAAAGRAGCLGARAATVALEILVVTKRMDFGVFLVLHLVHASRCCLTYIGMP